MRPWLIAALVAAWLVGPIVVPALIRAICK